MSQENFIPAQTLCMHYNIEISFVREMGNMGLIQLELIEQDQFIHQDEIGTLEKILRLHHELNMNLESIDVVLNLLEKEQALREEVAALKNRLRLYENG